MKGVGGKSWKKELHREGYVNGYIERERGGRERGGRETVREGEREREREGGRARGRERGER